jgi:hypothetical protein
MMLLWIAKIEWIINALFFHEIRYRQKMPANLDLDGQNIPTISFDKY